MNKPIRIAINWLIFLAVGVGIYFAWPYIHTPVIPWYLVLLFAVSLAFVWVETLKWGVTKPFNCMKCMTAWFSLLIAVIFHTQFWYFMLPAGLLVGALFDAVKMKL